MKRSQVLLLTVAVVAGGLAGFLVLRGSGTPHPAPTQQVAQVPQTKSRVLVASRDIGVGERLSQQAVQWQDWPDNAVRSEYITEASTPDAPTAMDGAVARFEIFNGEPIREAKLVRTDQGYLSAVLEPGMRGVSVTVSPASGSGGFIVPNDHVDVVSTYTNPNGDGEISQTVLSNVKVLAIGKRLGEIGASAKSDDNNDGTAKTFDSSTIATLELNSGQAETLLSAANASSGTLSLVLRSVADFAQTGENQHQSQAVSVIRYGKQANVMTGNDGIKTVSPASVDPASFTPDSTNGAVSTPDTPLVNLQ